MTACNGDNKISPDPEDIITPGASTLEIEIEQMVVKSDMITVSYTPTSLSDKYFFELYPKSFIEGYANDDELMQSMINDADDLLSKVTNGENVVTYDNLTPLSDYVAVAFGVVDSKPSTKLFFKSITTPDVESTMSFANEDFTVTLGEVSDRNVIIDLETEITGNFYVGIVTNTTYQSNYMGDPMQLATYFVQYEQSYYTDLGRVDNKWIYNGPQIIDISKGWNFLPETNYAICIFGVDPQGNLTTEPLVFNVTTMVAQPSPFKITLLDVGANNILINVETEYTGTYVTSIIRHDDFINEYNENIYTLANTYIDKLWTDDVDPEVANGLSVFQGNCEIELSRYWGVLGATLYDIAVYSVAANGNILNTPCVIQATTL